MKSFHHWQQDSQEILNNMEKDRQDIQGLDEYIRQGEPQRKERAEAWSVANALRR